MCTEENGQAENVEKEESTEAKSPKNKDINSEVKPAKEEESSVENSAKPENEDTKSEAKPAGLDPQIDNTTETSITISWQPPQDDDSITAYRITCKPKDAEEDGGKEKQVDDAATTTTSFEDLSVGTVYVLEVIPLMGEGEGKGFSVEAQTSKNNCDIILFQTA